MRKYDTEGGRFLSIDPLWEKYLAWSPYHYCGNNPVNAKDPSGMDYDVIIGENEIIVSAVYYANKEAEGALTSALDRIMEKSGKVTFDMDGKLLPIKFVLTKEIVDDPESSFANAKISSTNSNIFTVRNRGEDAIDGREFRFNEIGLATKNRIAVERSWMDDLNNNMHEIFHTLGVSHANSGVMTESRNSSFNSSVIFDNQIKGIIGSAIFEDHTSASDPLGKGTVKK